ncbi:MAG TPA: helix-turn-helix domain-containing protein [Terriglobales bacterium]|nr:helix-turn-helix domain-containing protein [Terriglobales bacterium]
MSPRSYNLGKRKASTEGTRARILEAARKLLATETGPADLSMEAVARAADVSRLTIYYQFESRRGLLEALYDYMADRGNMRQVAAIFQEPDPNKALEKMVKTFVEFWAFDPVVIRRVRGMAALDAEIAAGMQARDSRRRRVAGEIIRRFHLHLHQLDPAKSEQQSVAADLLSMLTGFETYDALAQAGHTDVAITEVVIRLSRAAIGSG